jgi:hypothetical protein
LKGERSALAGDRSQRRFARRRLGLSLPTQTGARRLAGHHYRGINLPSGGVGFVATTVPREVLAAFAEALSRMLAKGRRLARSLGRDRRNADPGDESAG